MGTSAEKMLEKESEYYSKQIQGITRQPGSLKHNNMTFLLSVFMASPQNVVSIDEKYKFYSAHHNFFISMAFLFPLCFGGVVVSIISKKKNYPI
jgi:hypothetical protein